MSDNDDVMSIVSVKSQYLSQNPRVRRLREKLCKATDHKTMVDLIFEYDDVIHQISPVTLNSWHNVPHYKFARMKNVVYATQSNTKYMSNKLLSERLSACEHNITLLQKYIEQILNPQVVDAPPSA
jgi:hypothetical protein